MDMTFTRMGHPRPFIEELRTLALFGGCTDRELDHVDEIGVRTQVEAGQVLCRQGRIGRQAFVVVAGQASVSIDDVEVAQIGPGGFFGEMSVLDGAPRVGTVTALSTMTVLVFTPNELGRLLDYASISRQMLSTVSARLRSVEVTA
jgi:CRP/FNR family transcriptional regulator, cyclic AMP receptor protein